MKVSGANTVKSAETIIGAAGILLIVFCGLLAYMSPGFSSAIPDAEKPVPELVALLSAAGLVYLFTVYKIKSEALSGKQILWITGVGILLRIILIPTQPILEDDYVRYLWDGAVTASGINPYVYSPEDVINEDGVPAALLALKEKSGNLTGNINHPGVRSIYPPVAQGFFALSYLIRPWSLTVWKTLILIADLATLYLLLKILGQFGRPRALVAVYWWNPLLLKEIYNSGHLDPLLFPFLLGALLLAVYGKRIPAVAGIIIAAGIKVWPAFLLPVVIKPLASNPKKLAAASALAVAGLALLFLPIYFSGLDRSSGLVAYGTSWQNNDSAFRVFIYASGHVLEWLGYKPFAKYKAARIIAVTLTALWIAYITLRRKNEDVFQKSLLIAAFVFLVSPTQFPWYYTWLLPLLAVSPRFSLLALTALLPLYYLRYYLEPGGRLAIFDHYVVWIEFVPVWVLIAYEWARGPGKERDLTAEHL